MDIAAYLKQEARRVDEYLDLYTRASGQSAGALAATSQTGAESAAPELALAPDAILEAMRYSLLGGGKRLRPILVIAAAAVFGAPAERVMPAACALEMIHTYSLIHDDLPAMDDDDLRRGRPTNHKVYGEAMAILAGDGLLTLAFEMLARQASLPAIDARAALRVVAEVASGAGAAGMVGGQVLDIAWETKGAEGETLAQIHRLKTGALFRASLRAGAILAGAAAADLAALDAYAEHFGLAFQIQDDVLDVIGDAAKTGKGVGRDEKHDKSTYVRRFGLDGARQLAQDEVAAAKAALATFGDRADILGRLADFVVDRDA
ncbi:MAG TPA: farnesyl diphosphate synthase [Symbiobacteriaceae bacterium]|nr:farnesyl diphosphate synthase [Symbiobacteriaceae bacterium]